MYKFFQQKNSKIKKIQYKENKKSLKTLNPLILLYSLSRTKKIENKFL